MGADYTDRLNAVKRVYPFEAWMSLGLPELYTPLVIGQFGGIFNSLIDELIELGEEAEERKKVAAFEKAVKAVNVLNEPDSSLIETGERDDLCELCNLISVACGIDPNKYGGGEGLASEWRDW